MIKILFVCLGNICRSPSAEAVMTKLIKDQNLGNKINCDSAGTAAYHVGEKADSRMRKVAKERGFDITSIARQIHTSDLDDFDYIIAMDESNYHNILALRGAAESKDKVYQLKDFCQSPSVTEVPDPYYGGVDGFHQVIDILEVGCSGLLERIKSDKAL